MNHKTVNIRVNDKYIGRLTVLKTIKKEELKEKVLLDKLFRNFETGMIYDKTIKEVKVGIDFVNIIVE